MSPRGAPRHCTLGPAERRRRRASGTTRHTASIDGGSGFGGPLLAACLDPEGRIVDLVEGEAA